MEIVRDLLKFVIPPVVLLLIPILLILVFDFAINIGQLFGRR